MGCTIKSLPSCCFNYPFSNSFLTISIFSSFWNISKTFLILRTYLSTDSFYTYAFISSSYYFEHFWIWSACCSGFWSKKALTYLLTMTFMSSLTRISRSMSVWTDDKSTAMHSYSSIKFSPPISNSSFDLAWFSSRVLSSRFCSFDSSKVFIGSSMDEIAESKGS